MTTFDISFGPVAGVARSVSRPMAASVECPHEELPAKSVYSDCVAPLASSIRENKALSEAFISIARSFTGRAHKVEQAALNPNVVVAENLKRYPSAEVETTVVEKVVVDKVVISKGDAALLPREGVGPERPEVVVALRPAAVVTPQMGAIVETAAQPVDAVVQPVDAAASPRLKEVSAIIDRRDEAVASTSVRPAVIVTERPEAVVTERPEAVVTPRPAVVVETVARPVETVVQSVDAAVQPVDAAASPRLKEVSTIIDRRDEAVASTSVRTAEDEAADEAAAAQQVVVEAPVRAESVQSVETAAPVAPVQAVSSANRSSPTEMVLAAAEAVADALTVTPGERAGDGEVVVRLRPDVLDGSVIRVDVSGADVAVSFTPATEAAARVLAEHVGELEAHLQHTVPAYNCEIAIADIALAAAQAESVSVHQMGVVTAQTAVRADAVVGNSNRKRT